MSYRRKNTGGPSFSARGALAALDSIARHSENRKLCCVAIALTLCGCQIAGPMTGSEGAAARLRPGPIGTPLPPRSADAARNWPPEFRRFIDAALEIFKQGHPEPSIDEFEARLGIKLTPKAPQKTLEGDAVSFHRAEAPWIPGLPSPRPPETLVPPELSFLIELRSRAAGGRGAASRPYLLSIEIDPTKRYCINPYELAIYTGARFTNSDNVLPNQRPRPEWARAYEWGMFKRGYYGNYRSDMGFSFRVNASGKWTTGSRDATCITDFRISADFKPVRRGMNTAALSQ